MAFPIDSPLPIFYDRNGDVLDAGYVYIGTPNLNPITSPVSVYWDAAQTIPAPQPLRTVRGFIARNGAPANLYVTGDFSIVVQDMHRQLVISEPTAGQIAQIISVVGGANGSSFVGFIQAGTGAEATTVQEELRYFIRPEQFGAVADGVTDDLIPIQEAFVQAAATGYPVAFSGKEYALSGGITFDLGSNSYFGNGSQLNFASAPDGTVCTTVIESGGGGGPKLQHVMEGFEFVGRDRFGTQVGTRFTSGSSSGAAITTTRSCIWRLFGVATQVRDNAFLNHFYACSWRNNGVCLDVVGAGTADAQENTSVFGGVMYNSEILVRGTECGISLFGVSLDYATVQHFNIGSACNVHAYGCHIEGSSDADYWIDVNGTDSSFNMIGGLLVKPRAFTKTLFPFGYSNATSASSIHFDKVTMAFDVATYAFPYVVEGYGTSSALSWINGGNGTAGDQMAAVTHSRANALQDGGFEAASLIDWYTGSLGAISSSTTLPRTGTRSMAITPTAGQIGSATARFDCDPGQWGICVMYMNTTGWGADSIRMRAEYIDRLGNTIGAAIDTEILAASRPTAYTRYAIRPAFPAPAGSSQVSFTITKRGPTFTNSDGLGVLYVDDAYVQVFGAGTRTNNEKNFFNRTAVAANTTFICPNGYMIEGIKILNTTANAVTGGIRIGTTAAGTQVATAIAVGANADLFVPTSALTLAYFSSTAAQNLFFEAVTAWNSASLNVSFIFRRIG